MSGPNPLLSQLFGTGQAKQAAATQQTPAPTEQEKQAAAVEDFLGRTAAHAYAQEVSKIASGEVTVDAPADPEFEAAAEKLAMDILHESGYNPFNLQPYANEGEKVAAAQAWDDHVKQAQAQEKVASNEEQVKQALWNRAWAKLDSVGFEPNQG